MFRNLLQRWLNPKRLPITRQPRRGHFRPRLEALEERTLLSASMVTDINTYTENSKPQDLVNLNGGLYFIASDNANHLDLWKNDANGPEMIATITTESSYYGLSPITAVGNRLFFTIDGDLWTSDGTASGTKALMHFADSIHNGPGVAFNGDYYFAANNGAGEQLWESDGNSVTAVNTGTSTLDRFYPQLAATNGELYFVTGNSTNGEQIWETDGTTTQALNLGSTAFGSIRGLTAVNGAVDFLANTPSNTYPPNPFYLYQYNNGTISQVDPTAAFNLYNSPETAVVNGQLFFTAEKATSDYTMYLWTVNDSGIQQIQTTGSTPRIVWPYDLHSVDNRLLFQTSSGLWTTDGTAANTKELPIGSTSEASFNGDNVPFDGYVYFQVTAYNYSQRTSNQQLWRTDGTNVQLIKSFDSTSYYTGYTLSPTIVGNVLYLGGYDPMHGVELWKSDGTTDGTSLAADINTTSFSSSPSNLTDVNGTLFFLANTGLTPLDYYHRTLYETDGTASGTSAVQSPLVSGYSNHLTNVNGSLFYFVNDPQTYDLQLWKADGSTATMVHDFGRNSVSEATAFDGKLYFTVRGQLWESDGTDLGTQRADLGNPDVRVQALTIGDGSLYFLDADAQTGDWQVWKTDGATATQLAANFVPNSASLVQSSPIVVNGALYFEVYSSLNRHMELWKGDASGFTKVATLSQNGLYNESLTSAGGRLFYTTQGPNGTELWSYDGTADGPTLLKTSTWGFTALTDFNGKLFFGTFDTTLGYGLWSSDGTVDGTQMVKADLTPFSLTVFDGKLYFTSGAGNGLWESDGTTDGTYLVQNVNVQNLGGSLGSSMVASNGRLYFTANDDTHGVELWVYDPATHFQISVSSGAPLAGLPFTITVSALDQFGNVDNDFQGTVHFTSSDGSVSFDHTFTAGDATSDDGVYSFTVTLPAGDWTLSANGSISGSLDVTVPADVSNQVGVTTTGLTYNRKTGLQSGQLILTQGAGTLNGPVDVVLQGLTSGVTLQAAAVLIDGQTYNLSVQTDGNGDPVLVIPTDVLGNLKGHQALRIEVQFYNPNHKQIDFTTHTFANA